MVDSYASIPLRSCDSEAAKMSRQASTFSPPMMSREPSAAMCHAVAASDAVAVAAPSPVQQAASAAPADRASCQCDQPATVEVGAADGDGDATAVVDADGLAAFLMARMDHAYTQPIATGCHFVDCFTLRSKPEMPLVDFLRRAMLWTHCSPTCYVVAVALMNRLISSTERHCHDPDFVARVGMQDPDGCCQTGAAMGLTPLNAHRLFAAALILSIKSTQDEYYTMSYYGTIFGVGALELRRLERALMVLLRHRLFVSLQDYNAVLWESAALVMTAADD